MLDLSTAGNQVTLGGTKEASAVIAAGPTVNFGHELIHALHTALGENIGPGLLPEIGGVRDPVTGRRVSPEEPRTITGRTRFDPLTKPSPGEPASFPAEFNVRGGITENDLRRDLGLPPRIAHAGAHDTIPIRRGATATVDALVSRYRVKNAPLPREAAAILRTMITQRGVSDEVLGKLPQAFVLSVPHPEHLKLRIRDVERRPQLADMIDEVTVQ